VCDVVMWDSWDEVEEVIWKFVGERNMAKAQKPRLTIGQDGAEWIRSARAADVSCLTTTPDTGQSQQAGTRQDQR